LEYGVESILAGGLKEYHPDSLKKDIGDCMPQAFKFIEVSFYRTESDRAPCRLIIPVLCENQCPCPVETFRNEWLTFELEENALICQPNHCRIKAWLEIPGANYQCYTHYRILGDPTLHSLGGNPSNRRMIFDSCIANNDSKELTVELFYGAGDPEPCLITKLSQPCAVNCCNSVELRFDRDNASGDDFNCFWKYRYIVTDPLCKQSLAASSKEVIVYSDPAGLVEIPQVDGTFQFLTIPNDGVIYYRIVVDGDTCSIRSDSLICDCTGCPGPDEYGQWFNVEMSPGGSGNCSPDQCYIKHVIDLDSTYSCYENFRLRRIIDDVQLPDSPEYPISMLNSILQQQDTCIDKDEFYEIKVILLTSEPYHDGTFTCPLRQTAHCNDRVFTGEPLEDRTCIPDCPQDTFVVATDEKYKSQICKGCELIISYKYRQACNGGKQDIQLTNMSRRVLPGYPPDVCNNCSEAAFMKEAIFYLLDENPMRFNKPKKGQCDTTWRIAQSNCWMTYYSYELLANGVIDSAIVRTPCESSCCVKPVLMCNTGRKFTYDNLLEW
jgi:hypothetical protein